MTAGGFIGRVGGLAVALGIGTAVAGWADCPAWADSTGGSTGASHSTSDSPAKKPRAQVKSRPKPATAKPATAKPADTKAADADGPEAKVQTSAGSAATDNSAGGTVQSASRSNSSRIARVQTESDAAEAPAAAAVAPQIAAAVPTTRVTASARLAKALRLAQEPGSPLASSTALAALAAVRDELDRKSVKSVSATVPQSISQVVDTSPNVLVIGVDGTNLSRVLADPANTNFFQLMQGGTTAPASIVGHTTISNPSWTTILTGVWGEQTGVINNIFNPAVYSRWPTVFNQLESTNPDIQTTSIANWDVISAIAVSGSTGADHVRNIGHDPSDIYWSLSDDAVGDATEAAITTASKDKPNFVFSYFVGVDENGHAYGGGSQQYAAAITNVDRNLGEIMAKVNAWEDLNNEQWTVIVVTDHGHQASQGFGHGFQSPNETSTFVIANNPNLFTAGGVNLSYQIVDVTPTVVGLFGGTPAPSVGVSLIEQGANTVKPINDNEALRNTVQQTISKYGYPNIGTDLKLGVRTLAASVPYFVNLYTNQIAAQLEAVAAQQIFLISTLAQLAIAPVKLVGSALYAVTNTVAQAVAMLTGVTGASFVPFFVPELPPLVGTQDPAPLVVAAICAVSAVCVAPSDGGTVAA